MLRTIACICCIVFITVDTAAQPVPAPFALRTDFLLNTDRVSKNGFIKNVTLPDALQQASNYQFATISNAQPFFSWQVDTAIKRITAFRIRVASTPGLLQNDQPDFWDYKQVSKPTAGVAYTGKPLANGSIYYWQLQVWNENNLPSAFSSINSFYYDTAATQDGISHYPLAVELQHPSRLIKEKNGSWFIDFNKDGFAQLQLHLNSYKSDSIWIEAAEALDSFGNISRKPGNIRYIKMGLWVEKGVHDYELQWPANEKRNSRNPIQMPAYIGEVFPFRYVQISNYEGPLEKNNIRRKLVNYPFNEQASSFYSSDTVLNKVWELCKYSIKATSFTGYYIDGDRERLPYEADALINQLSHYAVDAEYSMARRSMRYLIFHPTWPTEWSLQNILLAWNDYLYTGNASYLQQYYAELKNKLLMPLAGANGLISTRTGKQTDAFLASIHMLKDFDGKHGLKDNVDWPQRGDYIGEEKKYGGETDGYVYNDYNAVINAWYYHALTTMQKIAAVVNRKEDAQLYADKAKQVYNSFQDVFRSNQTGLIKDGDTTTHVSLHANMFALAFGLIPSTDIPAVTDFIKSRKMACSVYGAQFLLDALYDAGEADHALGLMTAVTQRSWYNMLRVGSTITMEAWDKLYKPNLDLNHAWGAAPANIIVRKLMGVEPLSAGADTLRIKPQLGDLAFANLVTSTIKGKVTVDCKRTANEYSMQMVLPGDTVAEVWVAEGVSNQRLYMDGKPLSTKPSGGYYVISNVNAGYHSIILK